MKDVPIARFEDAQGNITLHSLGKSRVLVVLAGRDTGAFGRAPFAALEERLAGCGALELFFDLREAESASLEVSASWGVWLRVNAARLLHVGLLTRAPAIALSARVVTRFSELGERAHIYADAGAFEKAFRSFEN